MDSAITSLTAETKSMHLDRAGFQSWVTGLEQRVATMEDHINTTQDRDQELLYLRTALSTMTNLTFDPPLELQRAQRLGPTRQDGPPRPCLIIACLLRHGQARQLLLAAQVHGPFWVEGYEIRISADFSKETNDRRKAFLSLRPRLGNLGVKYGLFEPARMRVTKNGVSKAFYKPEDLQLFLEAYRPNS
ncbi:hypothetical protein NDU88_005009 [Pleurodeles waltl]|uniref:L1 transposable element RRM domain-containing protein n=1 Tax=Pleurodeles waltl TaxID=8319 RepID=A0AAV7M7Z6_PLEWA|nr:hypothetical protein NDU88_005009 [Pleurodeles waltl]